MGLENANKNMPHDFGNLVIYLWKVVEKFGNIVKGVCAITAYAYMQKQ